jgi:hypothetical protein
MRAEGGFGGGGFGGGGFGGGDGGSGGFSPGGHVPSDSSSGSGGCRMTCGSWLVLLLFIAFGLFLLSQLHH